MKWFVQTAKGMGIKMNSLEKLGFELYDIDNNKVIYKQKQGYERIHVQIDFSNKAINFWAVFEDTYKREVLDIGVPLNVLEASIDILNDKKVVVDYKNKENGK